MGVSSGSERKNPSVRISWMEFVPDVGHQAMLVDVRKLKQGANVVDIVDKALRMGEGRQIKKLENVAKATNALEDEIAA